MTATTKALRAAEGAACRSQAWILLRDNFKLGQQQNRRNPVLRVILRDLSLMPRPDRSRDRAVHVENRTR